MRRSLAFVAFALLASGAAAQQLPPGPGRALVLEGCVQCHDLRPIVSQKKAAAAWRRTVNEMIWRGAPLLPGEGRVVADYLGEFFGTASRPAAEPPAAAQDADKLTQALPAGAGKDLLLSACVQCHGLATTTSAKKSEAEWRRTLEQMAAIGARIGGREQDVLARYLARALGEKQ
jgi:mono/diheme cytochrome c family protein